ncbi:MAG: DUF2846 domain-containing protein [Edaphobacter sp.]
MYRFAFALALGLLTPAALAFQTLPPAATAPNPSVAHVYVYRPHNKMFGNALHPTLSFDHAAVAKVPNGSAFEVDIAPGKHLIHVEDLSLQADETITATAGHTYFLRLVIVNSFNGGFQLVQIPEAQAKAEMAKLRTIAPDKVTAPDIEAEVSIPAQEPSQPVVAVPTTMSAADIASYYPWLAAMQKKYVGKKAVIGSAALHCLDKVATIQELTPPAFGTAYADTRPTATTNALGQTIPHPLIQQNSHLRVTVECPDDVVASLVYLTFFVPSVLTLANANVNPEAAHAKLQKDIDALIGTNVYALPGAKTFAESAQIADLAHGDEVIIPAFLAPLKITSGKIIDFEGYTYAVMSAVSEIGVNYLLSTRVSLYTPTSVLGQYFVTSISDYSTIDIEAVRSATPLVGMTRDTLSMMWGEESKDNNYGAGGHQLVYDRGGDGGYEAMIYTNSDDIVTAIQLFPK